MAMAPSKFMLTILPLLLSPVLGTNSFISSFSCAISSVTLNAGDDPLTVCNETTTAATGGLISLQWFTGSFHDVNYGGGCESVQISVYIDGEDTPSLQYYPYQLTGVPSIEAYDTMPAMNNSWSSALFGRYSQTSWNSNLPIPFSTSVSITLEFLPTDKAANSTVVYYQAHGTTNGNAYLGNVQLPSTARLMLQSNVVSLTALEYLPVVNVDAGKSGVVAALAMAFVAPNLNTLEGCFHFYPTSDTEYPGRLRSTGTEDEFLSSYYFDLGVFQDKSAGLFYITNDDLFANACMYRTYQDDPMVFTDGGSLVWRNGDTVDPDTGIKCMMETGGTTVGTPGTADVQTLSYIYVWDNDVADDTAVDDTPAV